MKDRDLKNRDADMALAAEYVLRLLPEQDVPSFETRLTEEPGLRAVVRDWTNRLGAVADEFADVAPHDDVKKTVLAHVFPELYREDRLSILRFLGGFGLGIGVWMLALALYVIVAPPNFQPGPDVLYTAELAGEGTQIDLAVEQAGTILITRLRGAPAFGKVYELWLIETDQAPRSLGLLPGSVGRRIPFDPARADRLTRASFAVSEELPVGAAGGAPTGPLKVKSRAVAQQSAPL